MSKSKKREKMTPAGGYYLERANDRSTLIYLRYMKKCIKIEKYARVLFVLLVDYTISVGGIL